MILFILHTFFNIYWTMNTYLMVTVRAKKFYTDEYVYAYMCFWGDWFSNFWFSIVFGGIMEADNEDENKEERRVKRKKARRKKKHSMEKELTQGEEKA